MKTIVPAFLTALVATITATVRADVQTNETPRKAQIVAYESQLQSESRYAEFVIDVNYSTDGTYSAFELKATTNNYMAATEDENLQFYAQSEIANVGGTHSGVVFDKMWVFACTSDYTASAAFKGDSRAYYYIKNTIEWTGHLNRVVVLVDTTCLLRHPQDPEHPELDWLKAGNTDLTWCYTRYAQNAGEDVREKENDHVLWRPIAPVRWFKEMPKWAKDQIEAN